MKFLNHSPLKGKKLQLIGGAVDFSLCQAPTGVGNDGIGPVIMSLIEYSAQTRPTSVCMQFKRPSKSSIGKNRCHGAQVPQLIKWLLAHVIPNGCSLLLACVFTRHQFMQGLGYLCELGHETVRVSNKPKKTSGLSNSGGGGPIFDGIDLSLIGGYSLGRGNVPQIYNLPAE